MARRHDLAQVRLVGGGDSTAGMPDVRVLPSQLAQGTQWADLEVGGEVKLDVVRESFEGATDARYSAAQLSVAAAGTVEWVHTTRGEAVLEGVVIKQPSGLLTQEIASDGALADLASSSWGQAHPLRAVAAHSGVPQATSDWCAAHFSDQADGGHLASLPRKGLLSPAIALGVPQETDEAAPGCILVLTVQGGAPQWAASMVGSVLHFGVEHVSDGQGSLPLAGDRVQFAAAADSRTAEVWAHDVKVAHDFGADLCQAATEKDVQSKCRLQLGTVVAGAPVAQGFRGAAQVDDGAGGCMLVPLVSADALEVGQRVPIALAVLDGVLSVPCGAASGVCASQACDVPALLSACNNSAALARTALATPLPAAAPSDWHAHVHWQPVAVAMPSTGLAAGPVAVLATAALGVLASPLHAVRMPVQRAIESGRIYSAPKRADSVSVQDGGVVHVPLSQLTVRGAAAAVAAAIECGLATDSATLCTALHLDPATVSAAGSLDAALVSHLAAMLCQLPNGRLAVALPLHEGMLATPDVTLCTGDVLSLPSVRVDTQAPDASSALQLQAVALACPRPQRYSGVVCRVKNNFAFLRPMQEQPTVASSALSATTSHGDIAVFLPANELVGTPDRAALAAIADRTPTAESEDDEAQPDDDAHDPLDIMRKGHALSGAPISLSSADVKSADGSFGVALGDVVSFDVVFVQGASAASDDFRVMAHRAVVEARVSPEAKSALASTAPSLDMHALLKGKNRKQLRQLGTTRHGGRLVKLSGAGQHAMATVHVQLSGDALLAAKGALAQWPGAAAPADAPQFAQWCVADALLGPPAAEPGTLEGAGDPLLDIHARQFSGAAWFARVHGGAAGCLLGSSTGVLAPWEACSTASRPSTDVALLLQSLLVDPAVSRVGIPTWAAPVDGLWQQVQPGHAGTAALATQCMVSAACAAFGLALSQAQDSALLSVPAGWKSSVKPPKGKVCPPLLEGIGAVTGQVTDAAAAAALSAWFCIPLALRPLHGQLEGTLSAKARLSECTGIARSAPVDAMQVNDWLTAAEDGVPCTLLLSRDEVQGSLCASAVKLAPLPKQGGESWGEAGAWDIATPPPAAAGAGKAAVTNPEDGAPLPQPPAGRQWGVVAQVHTKTSGRRGKKSSGAAKPHAWLTPLNKDGSDGAPRSVHLAVEDFGGKPEQLSPGRFIEYTREESSDGKRLPNARSAQLLPKAVAGQLRAARKQAEPAPAAAAAAKPTLVSTTVFEGRITREPSAPRAEGGGFFGGGGRRGAAKATPYEQYTGACVEVLSQAKPDIAAAVQAHVQGNPALLTAVPDGEPDGPQRLAALNSVKPGDFLEFPVAHCMPLAGGWLPAVVVGDRVAFVVCEGKAGAAPSASGWARTGAASAHDNFSARAVGIVSPQSERRTRHVGIVVSLPSGGRGAGTLQEITPVPKELRLDVAKRLQGGPDAVPGLQALDLSSELLTAAVQEAAAVASANGLWIPTRDPMVKLPIEEIMPHLQSAVQVCPTDVPQVQPLPLSKHFLGDTSKLAVDSKTHEASLQEGDVVEYTQVRVGRAYLAVRVVPSAVHHGRVPITILHQGATGITPPAPAAADTLVRHVLASGAVPVPEQDKAVVDSIASVCGVISLGAGRIGGVIAKRRGETALDMRGAQATKAAADSGTRKVQVSTVKSALQSATSGIGGASVPVQQAAGPEPDSIGFKRVRSSGST